MARLKRGLAPIVALAVIALAACDTEPAENVSYTSADARARVGCVDTRGSTGGYTAHWRIAYRKVGASVWDARPWRQYSCPDEQAPHYLDGSPFTESLTGLADGTEYEYRLDVSANGQDVHRFYDRNGTENGTDYDRFTTQQVPSRVLSASGELRDMYGINTRTAFNDTNYECWGGPDAATECQTVIDKLKWLGVRYIRDGLGPTWHVTQAQFYRDLEASGIKLSMGMSHMPGGIPFIVDQIGRVTHPTDAQAAVLRRLIISFEGINEPDHYAHGALCNDGHDNDSWADNTYAANDGRIDIGRDGRDANRDGDYNDPGAGDVLPDGDYNDAGEYQPDSECVVSDRSERTSGHQATGTEPCDDALDNDGDGQADRRDLQCVSSDESEKLAGQQDAPRWPERTRMLQQRIYELVNADPAIANKPVIGVSYAHNGQREVGDLGQWVDWGNFHPYPGDTAPDVASDGNTFGQTLAECRQYVSGKPCAATEQGYHTAIGDSPNGGVNQRVQASYSIRFLMRAWARGVKRFDFYNLVEQAPDAPPCTVDTDEELGSGDWGWHDCGWQPNRVATAMHRFTQTLGDGYQQGSMRLLVEQQPSEFQMWAYRRGSDGAQVLVLWRNVVQWNRQTFQEVNVPAQNLRLLVPDATEATLVRPVDDTSQQVAINDRRVTIALGGDPVMLVLK